MLVVVGFQDYLAADFTFLVESQALDLVHACFTCLHIAVTIFTLHKVINHFTFSQKYILINIIICARMLTALVSSMAAALFTLVVLALLAYPAS